MNEILLDRVVFKANRLDPPLSEAEIVAILAHVALDPTDNRSNAEIATQMILNGCAQIDLVSRNPGVSHVN